MSINGPASMFNLSEVTAEFPGSVLHAGFSVLLCVGSEVLCGTIRKRARGLLEFVPWGRRPMTIAVRRIRKAAPMPRHGWEDYVEATRRQRQGLSAGPDHRDPI